MSELIIADTSCLIVLQKIGRLELLKDLFQIISLTPEVQAEYGEQLPDWMNIMPVLDIKRQQLLELDRGEASALAMAMENPGSLLLIDERKGRKIA